MHPDIDSHVAALDSEVKGIGREMGQFREQISIIGNNMTSGFAELHRLIASRNQVNWTLVIGAGMFILAAIGYLQVSFLKPLQVIDDVTIERIKTVEARQWADHEMLIRVDERSKLSSPLAQPFGK